MFIAEKMEVVVVMVLMVSVQQMFVKSKNLHKKTEPCQQVSFSCVLDCATPALPQEGQFGEGKGTHMLCGLIRSA